MRALVQRTTQASVTIGGRTAGAIAEGLVVLVCAMQGDAEPQAERLARKVANLRIFRDAAGRMNRSLLDVGGAALVVSQFTLLADVGKGRRPSYTGAAPPDVAEPMIERFVERLRAAGVPTETGVFGARMEVDLVNTGPVTLLMSINQGKVR